LILAIVRCTAATSLRLLLLLLQLLKLTRLLAQLLDGVNDGLSFCSNFLPFEPIRCKLVLIQQQVYQHGERLLLASLLFGSLMLLQQLFN
jgi:hypothetical protein